MLRRWRAKAFLQGVFSAVPQGDRLNYFFQRHITRGYPASESALAADRASAEHHLDATRRYVQRPIEDLRFFEFGAGWDLAVPLLLSSMGVRQQLVVDLRPLARLDLARNVAQRVGLDLSGKQPDSLEDLLALLGVEYRAPSDARATYEPAESVDVITSTNTLEHIPRQDIALILKECHRILAADGLMSFLIDYKDHYSYFDPRCSPYEFLRFTSPRWRIYNPGLHYQNRLRHRDYLGLFEDGGFRVIEDHPKLASADDLSAIAALPPSADFRSFTLEQLGVRESHVVLAKRAS